MKKILEDYFYFTKSERRGVLVLITLVIITFIIPYSYPWFLPTRKTDTAKLEALIAHLEAVSTMKTNLCTGSIEIPRP